MFKEMINAAAFGTLKVVISEGLGKCAYDLIIHPRYTINDIKELRDSAEFVCKRTGRTVLVTANNLVRFSVSFKPKFDDVIVGAGL